MSADALSRPQRNARGQFLQGFTGNLGGRPRGSKNKLGDEFIAALCDDFEQHGLSAIQECRLTNPTAYCRLIAYLLPKETPDTASDFAALSDDELREYILREPAREVLGQCDAKE